MCFPHARSVWLKNHDLPQSHTACNMLLRPAQGPEFRLCLEQGPKYADGGCLAQRLCHGGRVRNPYCFSKRWRQASRKDGNDPTRDKDNQGPWEDWEWEDWEDE